MSTNFPERLSFRLQFLQLCCCGVQLTEKLFSVTKVGIISISLNHHVQSLVFLLNLNTEKWSLIIIHSFISNLLQLQPLESSVCISCATPKSYGMEE